MILLFAVALLLHPSNSEWVSAVKSHLSDNVRVTCEALPYRTAVVGTSCYFAVIRPVFYRETHALCSSVLKGAKLELNDAGVLRQMMVNQSTFHTDADTSGGKYVLCRYDSGYKCEKGQTLMRGKCFARVDKMMTYAEAQKNCKKQSLELPSIVNEMDNRIYAGELNNGPAWVQNTLVKRANKFVWSSERGYARYSTCDGSSRKPPLYSGAQKTGCKAPLASVMEKGGYWSNAGLDHKMAVYCEKQAENELTPPKPAPKKVVTQGDGPCAELHELDESTGLCEWTGPVNACAQLTDFWNKTYFIAMKNFPSFVFTEEDLKKSNSFMDDNAIKVVVRRGCMFTGYAYQMSADQWAAQHKVAENLVYGAHKLPNFITRDLKHDEIHGGLTRANCFCDPAEATVSGHEPAPPPDRKCIDRHVFNETTQQCEWTENPKFCAELHTKDNRRMLLEIPNWPTNKKYDIHHWYAQNSLNFHVTVTHIVVRQHCFATLYWNEFHEWKTLPTTGYGYHTVATGQANLASANIGTGRFVCECIK